MKSLIVSVSLIFSAAIAQAADDLSFNIKELQPQVVTYNGVKGVWFSTQDADKLLGFFEVKLPKLLDINHQQEAQIADLKTAVEKYKSSNSALQELADLRKQMVDTMLHNLQPPPPDPWYESPRFTFILGAVVGAGVVFGSTYAAAQTLSAR